MRFLTKQEIRSLAGTTIYSRGLSYCNENRVQNIQHNTAGSFTKIKAVVTGSLDYTVHLLFHEDGELQECDCDCPAHEGGMEICKHIAAVLLSIAGPDEPASTSKKRNYRQPPRSIENEQEATASLKKLFVDYFAGRMQSVESIGESLRTEFTLTFYTDYLYPQEQYFSIQIKIGTDKLYIVKDIESLLQAMRERSLLPFTKRFTFDPTYHYFDETDLRVLRKIEEIIRNQKWADRQTRYMITGGRTESEITIPPVASEEMIHALLDCANVLVKPSIGASVPLTVKQQWPGEFQLTEENGQYYLSYSSFDYPPRKVSLTPYYIWNDRLYETREDTDRQAQLLFHMLMDTPKGRLPLERSDLEQVYSQVVSQLNDQGRLNLDPQVDENVEEYPLQAKIYLDKKDNAIQADPLFSYGPHSLHAVTDTRDREAGDTLLVRDSKKEEEVLQLIESAGFHWNGDALSLADETSVYYFLTVLLPQLKEKADIFMSREVEHMLVSPASFEVDSSLDESLSWLDISFQTDDLNDEELYKLMHSLKEKKQYHKTSDGRYVPLDNDMLQGLSDLLEDTGIEPEDWDHHSLRLPSYKAFQADKYLHTGRQWQKSESLEKLLRDIQTPEQYKHPFPEDMQGYPREYQINGFQWLKALSAYGFGGILADDMGLGKTFQTLSYILSERRERPNAPPFLVVAPSSLVYNWEKESRMFTPELSMQLVEGSKAQRRKQLEQAQEADLVITSYPLLRRDIDLYEGITCHGLILDEAQALKNYTSKTFRAVRRIETEKAFALSGTPIENKIDELWSLFAILMPGLFPDVQTFKNMKADTIRYRVAPFIMRRTKKEVLTELPDKIETTLHCDLTKSQRETYVAYLNRIKEETQGQLQDGSFQQNRMNILANLTRLRQLCCHPGMFLEDYHGGSGKLEELMNFMKDARENGSRVLIFSQFTSMLSFIKETFDNHGYSYYYLDGQTPGRDRVQMTEQFNNGDKEAFLISLKAGGTGLNLTGADTVVLFDLWWNPAVETQAADRAHRIGQEQTVQVIKLISQGTIEEKIQELQNKKKELFDQVIQSGETNLSSLSEEDVRELLSI